MVDQEKEGSLTEEERQSLEKLVEHTGLVANKTTFSLSKIDSLQDKGIRHILKGKKKTSEE